MKNLATPLMLDSLLSGVSVRSLAVILFALCSLAFPSGAWAESVDGLDQVIALDERARRFFDEGDHGAALALLSAAQELAPASPRLYNMAVCHDELGHIERALELYREYLDALDTATDRVERVGAAIARLERLQQAPEDDDPSTALDNSILSDSERQVAEEPRARRSLPRAIFWALAGVTAASTLAMAVTGGVALANHQEFENLYSDVDGYTELQADGQRLTLATDVLLGVTAASAISTLILAFFTNWRRSDIALGPGTNGLSLELTGRF